MRIDKSKIIIGTHYFISGLADALVDFLEQNKVKDLLYLRHPLTPEVNFLQLFNDFVQNIFLPFRTKGKWDLFIGIDNLNAFSGLILKKLGKVKTVIYYTIDFSPKRFNNGIINKVYHYIDKICVQYCDQTWNLSPRMVQGRKEFFGMDPKKYNRQKLVPHGAYTHKMTLLSKKYKFNPFQAVFVGSILEKQGLQEVFRAILKIILKLPKFRLVVAGGGDYLPALKKLAKELRILKHVQFLGQINNEEKEKLLVGSAIGIATYIPPASFTYYADPGKIKDYLAAGLPLVLTDVSYNVQELSKNGCAIVVSYDKRDIAKAILTLLSNKNKMLKFRKNVKRYAEQFDWSNIYADAFRKIRTI